MQLTPQNVVDALHVADKELETLAAQYAWFKGQRDYWKDELDFALASAKVYDTGPVTKSKEAALVSVTTNSVAYLEWLPDVQFNLPEAVRITEASFDVVSKAYNRMETHIMILTVVNKNILIDYGRAS